MTTEGEADEDPKLLILHDDRIETLWALGVRSNGSEPRGHYMGDEQTR